MFVFGGPVTVGIAILLVAIAGLNSIVFKRVIVVVLATAFLYFVLILGVSVTYPTLLSPTVVITSSYNYKQSPPFPPKALVVNEANVGKNGTVLKNSYVNAASQHCQALTTKQVGIPNGSNFNQPLFQKTYGRCMTLHDVYVKYAYQPASRFWPLQWIYTAMTVIATLVIMGLAFWFLARVES